MEALNKDLEADYNWSDPAGLEAILEKFGIGKQGSKVTLTLWGSGAPYREFMFVDDLAEALLFVMDNYSAGKPLNIGTGEDIRIRDLALLIKEIVGFTGVIQWDTSKPDGTPKKQLDVSLLHSLGFKAPTSLRDGLKTTYQDYLEK
jgi:GDP-L-fucose synthase